MKSIKYYYSLDFAKPFIRFLAKRRARKLHTQNTISHLLQSYSVYNLWTGKYYFLIKEWDIINYDEIWYHQNLHWVIINNLIFVY